MREIGDTELHECAKLLVKGKRTLADFISLLDERPTTINMATPRGLTALHIVAAAPNFKGRVEALQQLIERGANVFLTTPEGQSAVDLAPEGSDRESLVSVLLAHRMAHETQIKSVAPLSASRLMKRTGDDTGTGTFSNVAPHCLYFSYKGAIFLWDVVSDVEHTIFQPRDQNPSWGRLNEQMTQFSRKKSLVAHGGSDPSFDPTAGETLAKQLKSIEQQVPLVTNFTIVSGLESQRAILPDGGVSEWIMCNTGTLIEVKLDKKGLRLRKGHLSSFIRRKSQVCGGSAEYPEGLSPHVNVHLGSAVRFTRRSNAGQICCVADGLYGTIGYVVAAKANRKGAESLNASNLGQSVGFNNIGSPQEKSAQLSPAVGYISGLDNVGCGGDFAISPSNRNSPPNSDNGAVTFLDAFHKDGASPLPSARVSFGGDREENSSRGGSRGGDRPGTSDSGIHCLPSDGVVFRILQFRSMSPKDGFDHCMKSLTSKWDPFCDCVISEKKFSSEECGDAVTVLQCRQEFFLLLTQRKLFVADVDPKRRFASNGDEGYRAEFFELTNVTPCGGEFLNAAALAPQRFRTIKPNHYNFYFTVVSAEAFCLYEMHQDRTAVPILKLSPDRASPHLYTPIFHPTENILVILYQSLMRQEVCTFDLVTQRMQAVCKLPKPSSLRFYSQPSEEELKARKKLRRQGLPTEPDPECPQLNVAFSNDATHLLRYNVSMHVMSVYSWDEIRTRAQNNPFINVSFTREPLPPPPDPRVQAAMLAKLREPAIKGSNCVWIIAESLDLQTYLEERVMTVANTTIPEGEEDPDEIRRENCLYADTLARTTQDVFNRIAGSYGGKVTPYTPPKFYFVPAPDDEYDEEELQQMENEYYCNMPRHHGVWAAAFVAPLEAVRCCIKLVREFLRTPWDTELFLSQDKYAPVKLEYQPKSTLEKNYPTERDPEATIWLNRGPKLRYYLCSGETTTPLHTLREKINPLVTEKTDGVIIIDPELNKVLKPLKAFFSSQPTPEAQVGAATVIVPPEVEDWLR